MNRKLRRASGARHSVRAALQRRCNAQSRARRAVRRGDGATPRWRNRRSRAPRPAHPFAFPHHAETHGMLGIALFAQGRISEAVPHFERTAALKPNLPGIHDDLGKAYLAAGRTRMERSRPPPAPLNLTRPSGERRFSLTAACCIQRRRRSPAQVAGTRIRRRLGSPARAFPRVHRSHQARSRRGRVHRARRFRRGPGA